MNTKMDVSVRTRIAKGFSLVEVMFACAVLAIALVGAMAMIVVGVGRNASNRMDTTATNVAQTVLEAIAAMPASSNKPATITDCQGNNIALTTTQGGPAGGAIDFTQAPVIGYQANYVMCGSTGPVTYDVRWRIDLEGFNNDSKLVTVAARQVAMNTQRNQAIFVPPVTLQTVVGQ